MASLPSNAGEQPLARSTLLASGIVTNNKQFSTTQHSAVYVPPTNTNMVNPQLISGQTLASQPVVNQPS